MTDKEAADKCESYADELEEGMPEAAQVLREAAATIRSWD